MIRCDFGCHPHLLRPHRPHLFPKKRYNPGFTLLPFDVNDDASIVGIIACCCCFQE